jgi:hypothetical protein
MDKIRRVALNDSAVLVHGNVSVLNVRRKQQTQICHNFWDHFFEYNCQRPTMYVRLFPTNRSYLYIFDFYFKSWFLKQYPDPDDEDEDDDDRPMLPSIRTFTTARHHVHFSDVVDRSKHYHARCADCALLTERRIKGFLNQDQQGKWEVVLKLHEAAARGWHEGEGRCKAKARAEPDHLLYITFDDTKVVGFPKLTNRDLKNFTYSRFEVTPFNLTCYSNYENSYVYTAKYGWTKGANRLCSVLYFYLRKIKYGDHVCWRANVLVLHADNYSENKNNDLFFFLCELIYRRWFTEIRLEYGPVGHTHNGNDAVHAIHNRVAGNFTSLTMGEFVKQWEHGWRKGMTVPVPVIAEAQYDFVQRYSHLERLSGFTKTKDDKETVSAWKFQWSETRQGIVEVVWKKDTADQNWRGEDLQVSTLLLLLLVLLLLLLYILLLLLL